jgi:hypothetical protein
VQPHQTPRSQPRCVSRRALCTLPPCHRLPSPLNLPPAFTHAIDRRSRVVRSTRGHSLPRWLPLQLASTAGSSEYLWVADPIDGTTNFVHALPLSVVSIGVARKGVVVVAVIFDPYRDELFTAIRGGGAFLNGVPIRVSKEAHLSGALLSYGFNVRPNVFSPTVRAIERLLLQCRGTRCLGSACLHLAWTAAGRFTVSFACLRARVRARVRACVCACVCVFVLVCVRFVAMKDEAPAHVS